MIGVISCTLTIPTWVHRLKEIRKGHEFNHCMKQKWWEKDKHWAHKESKSEWRMRWTTILNSFELQIAWHVFPFAWNSPQCNKTSPLNPSFSPRKVTFRPPFCFYFFLVFLVVGFAPLSCPFCFFFSLCF